MIIVPDKEKGLKKLSIKALSLVSSRAIQGWDLSDDFPGVVLNLYPGMADVVKERGGKDAYRASILREFVALGYKEYEEPKPEVEEKVEEKEE